MSIQNKMLFMGIAAGLFCGCSSPGQDDGLSEHRAQAMRILNASGINGQWGNGTSLGNNGVKMNGIGLGTNGVGINGSGVEGTGVSGLTLDAITFGSAGTPVTAFFLVGSELHLVRGGQTLRGTEVIGAELHYRYQPTDMGPSYPFTVRVASAGLDPTASGLGANHNDVWMYNLLWQDNSPGVPARWQALCRTEAGADDQSLMLANRWDPATGNRVDRPTFITFACRDQALGKCARMGYRPWAKANSCSGTGVAQTCADIALADHHQACTRMIRADYCGNGTSYTIDGTLIDIYDYLNPPLQVSETDWDIEAQWTPNGALCINEPRHPELLKKWQRPDCDQDGKPDAFPACGRSAADSPKRGLLANNATGAN